MGDKNIVKTVVFDQLMASGLNPKEEIIDCSNALNSGESLELITGFYPAPLVALLQNQGFEVSSNEVVPGEFHTIIQAV